MSRFCHRTLLSAIPQFKTLSVAAGCGDDDPKLEKLFMMDDYCNPNRDRKGAVLACRHRYLAEYFGETYN